MRVLIATDKFKHSLTAPEVSDAIMRGMRRAFPREALAFNILPIADGGEGFTEAVLAAVGGEWREVTVDDAQGRPIKARYGMIQRNGIQEAVMEMSAASGLALVRDLPLNPRKATTRGTGQMMKHAIENGARRILIGIGGSATNDGGSGMASVFACDFLDEAGQPVTELPLELDKVQRVVRRELPECEIVVACDVTNPLLGEFGATNVYGRQKGVDDVNFFEDRMKRLAELVQRDLYCDHCQVEGAGAAGGLGYGLMTFCQARLKPGFDMLAELSGLRERIQEVDLVITGEGKLDGQTLHGKGPLGVAKLARECGKPVIGIGGIVEENEVLRSQFDGLLEIKPPGLPVEEAIRRAGELLEEAVAQRAEWLKTIASRKRI